MSNQDSARKLIALACIWAALLLAPYWMPPLGGYTALGTRVLVLGLAAMSVNFLLGFTGVLSFGHAAYFGLGAYGAGFALKFLAPSSPLSLLMGMLLGGLAGALLGTLIVRRRGVYFAMVTIAFGQVFYYIAFQWSSLTGGDDGLRGFSRQPLDFGLFSIDILSNANNFYYFVLVCFASSWRSWALSYARRSAAPWWRSAKTNAGPASSASRWSVTSGSPSRCPASSWDLPGRFMRC